MITNTAATSALMYFRRCEMIAKLNKQTWINVEILMFNQRQKNCEWYDQKILKTITICVCYD